jgi:hypothetical protein
LRIKVPDLKFTNFAKLNYVKLHQRIAKFYIFKSQSVTQFNTLFGFIMIKNTFLLAVTFLVLSFKESLAQTKDQLKEADFIIRNVSVLTMKSPELIGDQIVCIKNGAISFIGKDQGAKKIKTNAKVINGNGKYLMPGLADMHCHFPEQKEIKNYFLLSLMGGVTTVRSMRGEADHLTYAKDKNLFHPNLYLSGPPVSREMVITNKFADSLVSATKKAAYDFIKVLSIKDSASFETLMSHAKKQNLPVCGHFLGNVRPETLLKSGYNSIEHLGGQVAAFDKGQAYFKNIISLTKQNQVYHCPTLDWYQIAFHQLPESELKKRVGIDYFPDTTKQNWSILLANDIKQMGEGEFAKQKENYRNTQAKQFKILKQFADENVPLLVGVDAGGPYSVQGFGMVEEMKLFRKAGLTNYQILQAATINAAKYLHQEKQWGIVEAGNDANLILLTENPLTSLETFNKIEGVFLNKEYYEVKKLEAMLDK